MRATGCTTITFASTLSDVPHLDTLNIGHAIISRAIFLSDFPRQCPRCVRADPFAFLGRERRLGACLDSAQGCGGGGRGWSARGFGQAGLDGGGGGFALVFLLDAIVGVVGFRPGSFAREVQDLLVEELGQRRALDIDAGNEGLAQGIVTKPRPSHHRRSGFSTEDQPLCRGLLRSEVGGQRLRGVALRRAGGDGPTVRPGPGSRA